MISGITTLIYHYQRASVPLPYQRHAAITVDTDRIKWIIYSDAGILHQAELATPIGLLEAITQWLQDFGIAAQVRQTETNEHSQYPSTDVHALTIYSIQQRILNASSVMHADTETAILTGNIAGFVQRLTQELPGYADDMRTL